MRIGRRFSIASIVLVTCLVAAALVISRGYIRAAAIRRSIVEIGGTIDYSKKGVFYSVTLAGTNVSPGHIQELSALGYVRNIDLSGTKLSRECLEALSSLKDVKSVILKDAQIEKQYVGLIGNMNIEYINIAGTGIGDDELKAILASPTVGTIMLDRSAFSDRYLKSVLSNRETMTIIDASSFELIEF